MLAGRVVVRVRPLTETEQGHGHGVAVSCCDDNRTVQIDPLNAEDGKRIAQNFSLDASVPPEASQVRRCPTSDFASATPCQVIGVLRRAGP